jgi:hypothetical protein
MSPMPHMPENAGRKYMPPLHKLVPLPDPIPRRIAIYLSVGYVYDGLHLRLQRPDGTESIIPCAVHTLGLNRPILH